MRRLSRQLDREDMVEVEDDEGTVVYPAIRVYRGAVATVIPDDRENFPNMPRETGWVAYS